MQVRAAASSSALVVLAAVAALSCGASLEDDPFDDAGRGGGRNAGGASRTGGGGEPTDASSIDTGSSGSAGWGGASGQGGASTGGSAGTAGSGTGGTGRAGSAGSGASAGASGASGGGTGGATPRPDATIGADVANDARLDQRGPDASSDRSGDAADDGGALPPLVPGAGVLLGMFFGADSLAATETTLGRKVAVRLTYYAWNDDWTRGNTSSDLSAGRIPLVNWEPHTPTLDDIIGGVYDAMLHTRAAAAKALAKPFFLDWGAEMNGNWAPWDGSHNGNSSAKYIAAYRHIHDIFVADGATNVVWAWCPNVTDEPRAAWNETLGYYPGDDYVDWTCVDGYNWGTTNGGGWQTFPQVFSGVYAKLATKGKPILIGEMASTEEGGDKAQWIAAMVPALKSNFPLIKGFVWFDINKETDWRIASSTASRDAFVLMGKDPYLNP